MSGDSRADRLRRRRKQQREQADRSESDDRPDSDEPDDPSTLDESSELSEPSKPAKPPEPSKSTEPSQPDERDELSDQSDADGGSVKDERVGTYMYLPEELRRELDFSFKELGLAYDREFDRELEKNRHFYPLIVSAGLERLEELGPGAVDDRLDDFE